MSLIYRIVFLFALTVLILREGIGQDTLSQQFMPDKILYVHPWDLVRIYSPAFKFNFEHARSKDLNLNYEASIITDFQGRHIWSNLNYNSLNFVYGFSIGFYPMVSLSKYQYAGFRVNYSLKYRQREQWVQRYSGAFSQELEYDHLANSVGFYYRYELQQLFLERMKFSIAVNAGILGSYVTTDLPEDVPVPDSGFGNFKPRGFSLYPHIYFEFKLGFPIFVK